MFTYRFLLTFLFLLQISSCYAQREANYWYFGVAAFDFSNGMPIALNNSKMIASYGSSTMSDKQTGELLFYSNGRNVWNRIHKKMPNSTFFGDSCSSSFDQSSLIVPCPGKNNQYYLFSIYLVKDTLPHSSVYSLDCEHIYDSYFLELRYSLVDMALDGGYGDIVPAQKDIFLQTKICSKLTAIPHSNGKDFWLLTHELGNDEFCIYLINEMGIHLDKSQKIGSLYDIEEIAGELKASPDGKKIASAVDMVGRSIERPFDVFDFDNSTGTISNYQNFGNLSGQNGVSFSPDNSKLYITTDIQVDNTAYRAIIFQYDLSLKNTDLIISSGKSIIRNNPNTNIPLSQYPIDAVLSGLQIGLDGRIYARPANRIIVISKPNLAGFDCEVNYENFNFNPPQSSYAFPNFIQSYFNNLASLSYCTEALVYPNPVLRGESISLKIENDCSVPSEASFYDFLGRLVLKININKNSTSIKTNILQSGIYLMVLSYYNNRFSTIKLIIK